MFCIAVWYLGTLATFAVELPPMERTLEAIAPDNAAGRHVRPVMRTVRIDDVNQPIFTAKNGELLSCYADK